MLDNKKGYKNPNRRPDYPGGGEASHIFWFLIIDNDRSWDLMGRFLTNGGLHSGSLHAYQGLNNADV